MGCERKEGERIVCRGVAAAGVDPEEEAEEARLATAGERRSSRRRER